MGSGVFPGMDDLDPIAIFVLFEEQGPQTESCQDDQAGVCLGQADSSVKPLVWDLTAIHWETQEMFLLCGLGVRCHSLEAKRCFLATSSSFLELLLL